MFNKIHLTVFSLFLGCYSLSHAVIVGPVNVLQTSDGAIPALCGGGSMGAVAGGIAEMALDLDQDGTVDVCFGSYSDHCNANFNFDALTLNGTILSTQDDASGFSIMGGANVTLAFWDGQAVGPNFQAASGSTSSANIGQPDEPLVFGFRGGSNTALTEYGMFSFTVNSADCSITFGSVDHENGANTYSSVVAPGAPANSESIPTLSFWGLLV
jgi:hypothetical protein